MSTQFVSKYGPEVDLLMDELDALEPGQMVRYDDLTTVVGVDVRANRIIYQTALRRMQKESGKVFTIRRGEGIELLNADGVVSTGTGVISKIRRTAKRGKDRLSTVKYDELSATNKVAHNVQLTVLSFIEHGTKRASVNKVKRQIEHSPTRLSIDINATLELMK